MASTILLTQPKTGLVKRGFYGFSWTMLLFGGLVPLFRGDVAMGLLLILLQLFTWGLGTFIFAFFYNKQYTTKLIEQGYVLAGSENENAMARTKIGILAPAQ
jgi:xanthine/uracil permease